MKSMERWSVALLGTFVPLADEPIDAGWRRIDVARDSFEAFDNPSTEWPDDLTRLYWWRPTFWRSERA